MHKDILFIKDGIVYDTAYGFSKPWICENSIWLLPVLEFTYGVIIFMYINSPGRGRHKIYGINGSDKSYLRHKNFMVGTA